MSSAALLARGVAGGAMADEVAEAVKATAAGVQPEPGGWDPEWSWTPGSRGSRFPSVIQFTSEVSEILIAIFL
jgi:hypothetical protein